MSGKGAYYSSNFETVNFTVMTFPTTLFPEESHVKQCETNGIIRMQIIYPTLIPKKEISFLAVEWIFDFDSSSNIIWIKILSFSFRSSITMRVMVTNRSSSSLEPFRLFRKSGGVSLLIVQ